MNNKTLSAGGWSSGAAGPSTGTTDQLLKQTHLVKPLESLSSNGEASFMYRFLESLKAHQSSTLPTTSTTHQEGPLKTNLESFFETQLSNPLFLENLIKTMESLQSLHFNLKDAQLTLDPPLQDYRSRLETLQKTLGDFYAKDLEDLRQSSLEMAQELQEFL